MADDAKNTPTVTASPEDVAAAGPSTGQHRGLTRRLGGRLALIREQPVDYTQRDDFPVVSLIVKTDPTRGIAKAGDRMKAAALAACKGYTGGRGEIRGGYRSESGSYYWGEWNSAGQRNGPGTLRLPDKSLLRANFHENMATGLGVLHFPDGAKYEGELLNGWFHGNGVFWRSDGMKFEGTFKGGRVWGLGLVTFPDGSHGFPRHEGFFQDCRLITRQKCPEIVMKAQKAAFLARIRDD